MESDKTGAVTLISSQVTAPFSTHILIDGYDIPQPSGPPPGCRVRANLASARVTLRVILSAQEEYGDTGEQGRRKGDGENGHAAAGGGAWKVPQDQGQRADR